MKREVIPEGFLFPDLEDGVAVMEFIDAALKSNQKITINGFYLKENENYLFAWREIYPPKHLSALRILNS